MKTAVLALCFVLIIAGLFGCDHRESLLMPSDNGVYTTATLTIRDRLTQEVISLQTFDIPEKNRIDMNTLKRIDIDYSNASLFRYRFIDDLPLDEQYGVYLTIRIENEPNVFTVNTPGSGYLGDSRKTLGRTTIWIYTVNGMNAKTVGIELYGVNYLRKTVRVDTVYVNLAESNLIIPESDPTVMPDTIDTSREEKITYEIAFPEDLFTVSHNKLVLREPILFMRFRWHGRMIGRLPFPLFMTMPSIFLTNRVDSLDHICLYPVSGIPPN